MVGSLSDQQAWQQVALLEGIRTAPLPVAGARGKRAARPITLPTAPEALRKLQESPDPRLAAAAEGVAKQLIWPGKDGKPLPVPPPLPAKYQELYELGRSEYQGLCAACHNPKGYGEAGKAPALLDSEWLGFSEERLVRLVLQGLRGPMTVNGEVVNRDGVMEMPGMAKALDDRKIAAILTYIRREWGDSAPPVESETVARIRATTNSRQDQWIEQELLQVK
jgi:mono/diheme cytochrome c family protein